MQKCVSITDSDIGPGNYEDISFNLAVKFLQDPHPNHKTEAVPSRASFNPSVDYR